MEKKVEKEVSIIIVNYKCKELIFNCVNDNITNKNITIPAKMPKDLFIKAFILNDIVFRISK